MSSTAVAESERAGSEPLPKRFQHVWEAFAEVVPADVADPGLAVATDPAARIHPDPTTRTAATAARTV
jgi:hypothetical protein